MNKFAFAIQSCANCAPHLDSEQKFIDQVKRQIQSGYHLAFLQENEKIKSLAGFRFLEFLAWGKVLYIDDLVSDAANRKMRPLHNSSIA